MKTPAPLKFFCRAALCTGLALLLGALPVPARGGPGADSVQRFKDDVRFLGGKMLPAKYRVRRQPGGENAWAELQEQIEQLKRVLESLQDLGGRIDEAASRLHYLKAFEVEPKLREVERVRLWAEQQTKVFADRLAGLQREGDLAGAKPHNGKTEATCPTCQEVAAIGARYNTVQTEARKFLGEAEQEFERAGAAADRAQEEMSEVGTKHGQAATEFGEVAGQYAAIRDPLAGRLQEIESQPEATVVTSPFGGNSVPAGAAGTLARPAPIGAGVTPRALDQLRIVTATSRTATDTPDDPLRVGPVTTRMVSGYQFDTKEGLPPVDLPPVDTPEGVPVDAPAPEAAVPLVLAPSPTVQQNAPAAILASPRLHQAESDQLAHFGTLERLYAERKELAQRGAATSPQDWTRVVSQISATQAQINFAEVTKRLSAGSAAIDMTLRTKPRRTSDIIVPPPDSE